MSTKIYDAYEFVGKPRNIHSLFVKLEEIRNQRQRFLLARGGPFCKDKVDRLYKVQLNREMTREDEREAECLTEDIIIYPHIRGRLFIQVFGAHWQLSHKERLCSLIDQDESFVDFHYQNQTDMPESISRKKWEERKRIWDIIFKEDHTPVGSGLSFPISSVSILYMNRLLGKFEV